MERSGFANVSSTLNVSLVASMMGSTTSIVACRRRRKGASASISAAAPGLIEPVQVTGYDDAYAQWVETHDFYDRCFADPFSFELHLLDDDTVDGALHTSPACVGVRTVQFEFGDAAAIAREFEFKFRELHVRLRLVVRVD